MKARDIRRGDKFSPVIFSDSAYVVLSDAELIDAPEWFYTIGRPQPEIIQAIVVRIQYNDGGIDYRYFDPDRDVALTRPVHCSCGKEFPNDRDFDHHARLPNGGGEHRRRETRAE